MKTISFHCCPRRGLVPLIATLLGSALFVSSLPLARADWLNDALDCYNLPFTTYFYGTGNAWSLETTIKHTGASSMKSGSCYTSDPNYPSYSYIETSIYGPGHLCFWWKVSCAVNSYLYLCSVGGPLPPLCIPAHISGEVDWTYVDVIIPPGLHHLQWRYEQGNQHAGSDAGWLDGVAWLPTWPALVVRGMDNRIFYRGYDQRSEAWGSWDSMPNGATCDSPAAVVIFGKPFIVVRGMDGSSLWYGQPGWGSWYPLDGATPSAPTLTSNDTALCLVVRGEDNRIYYRLYTLLIDAWPGWGPWHVIPTGATCDSPAAALLGNELNIVVRGMDGNSLWYTKILTTDNTVLEDWTKISGATPSKPVLAAAQDEYNPTFWPTTFYLVVRGKDNGIWYRKCWPEGWGDWTKLPGATCDAPAACYWWEGWAPGVPGNYLHLVVRGLDGNTMWHMRLFQDSSWSLITGATPSAPTMAGCAMPNPIEIVIP